MAKELIIPQGIYKVGVDFPEGSYVFDSKNTQTYLSLYDKRGYIKHDYKFDDRCGYQLRLTLSDGETINVSTKIFVSKAEPLNFD